MNINIRMAKDVLLFENDQLAVYDTIKDVFRRKVKEKYAGIMKELSEPEVELYKQLADRFEHAAETEAISHIWHAPEFVGKILDYPYESKNGILSFTMQAAEAEAARTTAEFNHAVYPYLWTANGDYLILYDREAHTFSEYHAFKLKDTITLDFFSPHCIKVDNKELKEDPSRLIEEYNYEEAFAVYERLEESVHPLFGFHNSAADLVSGFTQVIIFKKQVQHEPVLFSSASKFPYIGRSLLINADKADTSQLIDALVHESVHSLLYMIDVAEKWMPSNAAIRKAGNSIISPWTGKLLDAGNFCQAIFVWYGLFNFWQLALANNIYSKEYGEKRIAMIQKGFKAVDIHSLNNRFDLQLHDAALETMSAVRDAVLQHSYASATPY